MPPRVTVHFQARLGQMTAATATLIRIQVDDLIYLLDWNQWSIPAGMTGLAARLALAFLVCAAPALRTG
jgi:hypothetical protein